MSVKHALVIGMQKDRMPGGLFPVPGASLIIQNIIKRLESCKYHWFTQDWYDIDNISFAYSHAGKKAFESVLICERFIKLWPAHCIAQTYGARIVDELEPFSQGSKATPFPFRKGIEWYDYGNSAYMALHRAVHSICVDRGEKLHLLVMGVATEYAIRDTVCDLLTRFPSMITVEIDPHCIAALDRSDGQRAVEEMVSRGAILLPTSTQK
jgi:nicotinamidase/pyrazinamidase